MKPGYKTTEFWLTLLTAAQPFLAAPIAAEKASAIAALAVGLYSIARGIAKRAPTPIAPTITPTR